MKEKYVCVQPDDNFQYLINKFEAQKPTTMETVKQWMLDSVEHSKKEFFSRDLTKPLTEFFDRTILTKVMQTVAF